MAFSRRLGVIGIVGASWLVALGCDDDEDIVSPTASAGEGGEAPGGGTSSVAGSQNNAGKAGASAGSAGEGGSALGGAGAGGAGGEAGNGGSSGEAGQAGAGETAGVGGGGESAGGAGGQGGSGGDGGDGGTASAVAASCSYTCANDEACAIGQNTSQKCNPVSHHCEDPATACTSDTDCLLSQSFWTVTCVDDDGCDPDFEACVAVNGQGYCATLTADPDPDFACFGGSPRTFSRFGAVGNVEVCASPDPRCRAGACTFGCGDPLSACGQGNGNTCSAATGLCECAQGSECTKTGVCGGDGHCTECAVDGDCAATVALTGYGVCVAGKCGCADPTTCVNPGYATATAACQ